MSYTCTELTVQILLSYGRYYQGCNGASKLCRSLCDCISCLNILSLSEEGQELLSDPDTTYSDATQTSSKPHTTALHIIERVTVSIEQDQQRVLPNMSCEAISSYLEASNVYSTAVLCMLRQVQELHSKSQHYLNFT